jgi:G3E family GTPase
VLIEASGISDPASIADAVQANPELIYGGTVSLLDAVNAPDLLGDAQLKPLILQQLKAADLVLLTKCSTADPVLAAQLAEARIRRPKVLNGAPLAQLLFDVVPLPGRSGPAPHPAFTTWQHSSHEPVDRRALGDKLAARPAGLYRMKGFVLTSGGSYELHIVGAHVEAKRCQAEETRLVALGLKDRITREEIETWWTA